MARNRRWILWLAISLLGLAPAAGANLRPGQVVPDIQAPQLTAAAPLRLSQLRGKVVYLDVWASWCAPCQVSLPRLQKMRSDYAGQGFEVVGLNVDRDPARALASLRRAAVRYPNLHGVDATVLEQLDVAQMPSAYLIDRHGVVRLVHRGFRAADEPHLREAIEQLLEETR